MSAQVRVTVALCCLLLAGVVEDGGGVALETLELVGTLVGSVAALGRATLVVGVAGAGTGLSVALVLRLGRLTALVGSRHLGRDLCVRTIRCAGQLEAREVWMDVANETILVPQSEEMKLQ